jgi:hypothetical protein
MTAGSIVIARSKIDHAAPSHTAPFSFALSIPLHEHLIEQGFIEFAQSKGKGPLF